jgi:ferrous-iron efflux pump FieF
VSGKAQAAISPQRHARLLRLAGLASVTTACVLVALKLWAWVSTDSVAMLSSLADSTLDLMASGITLIAVRLAVEPPDREHRFGHGKLEALAGLVQALIIFGSAAYVAFRAIDRLIAPQAISAPEIGSGVTVLSMILTGILLMVQRYVISQTGSVAIRADAMHYRADLISNLAVLLAIGLNVYLGWYAADPVLGLIVVLLILYSVREIVRAAVDILLDRELPSEMRKEILEIAKAHSAVMGAHDLRTRSSSVHDFIQLHLELDPSLSIEDAHEIATQVESAVRRRFARAEILIHVDPYGLDEPRDEF